MGGINWSKVAPKRQPTKAEAKLYRAWRAYLADSRLTDAEQHRRAINFTEQGRRPQP